MMVTFRRIRSVASYAISAPGVLTLLGAFLTIWAMYVPHMWWLVFVSLIPFIHAIRIGGTRKSLVFGGVFGLLVLGSATCATVWAELPEFAQSFGSVTSFLLVGSSWLLFFVPLVPTVMAWSYIAASLKKIRGMQAVGLTAAWVLFEWLRMYVFNMATFTPGVNNPPFFSAGFLGYIIADSESWLQLASIGGVYLMSAAVVFINLLLYILIHTRKRMPLVAAAGLVFIVSVLPVATLRGVSEPLHTEKLTVGFMSLYPDDRGGYGEIAVRERSLVDLVVLPENTAASALGSVITDTVLESGTELISTERQSGGGIQILIATVQAVAGGKSSPVRVKSILAAQGEYVAGAYLLLAKIAGLRTEQPITHLTSGTWGAALAVRNTAARVSVMFCVEMLAPGFGKELALRDRSNVLALAMSHKQFRGAPTLQIDTLRFIKVQAVTAGLPLVASGKSTPGYAIDRYGRVMRALGEGGGSEFGTVSIEFLSTDLP